MFGEESLTSWGDPPLRPSALPSIDNFLDQTPLTQLIHIPEYPVIDRDTTKTKSEINPSGIPLSSTITHHLQNG